MVTIILAVLVLIAGFVVSFCFRQKVKDCEEDINDYKDRAEAYRKRGEGYEPEANEMLERAKRAEDKLNLARKNMKLPRFVGIGLAIVIFILGMVAIVPTGHTGVVVTFGNVEDKVLQSGLNFIIPWQNVVNMDNREQRFPFTLEAFSKDIQQVDIQGSININIDKPTAMNLYKNVGAEYVKILVQPRILEDVKIIIAQYTAESLIENRQKAADAIYDLLKSELAEKGINVISFAIENVDFTDAFESAVEAKQVATQEKQKAQTEQERQTMEATQKAERERIAAQAEADVKKIHAEAEAYAVKVQAEAQAEANEKVAKTLSQPLIEYNKVLLWDGKLPVVSSDGMNIINLNDAVSGEKNE